MRVYQIVEADPTFTQGKTTPGGVIVPDDFKSTPSPSKTDKVPAGKVTTGPGGVTISSIDADGKLNGKFPDGKEFKGLSPEDLRTKTPGHIAKSKGLFGKIGATLNHSKIFAAFSVIFGAIQVYQIVEDQIKKTSEVAADMESWRFINPEEREQYFQKQVDRINHAAYTNITAVIAGQLVATLEAGRALAKLRGAFAVIAGAQATTGIGIIAVIAEYLAMEGAVWGVTWLIKNYGEEVAAWMWDSFWSGVVDAAASLVGIEDAKAEAPDTSTLPTAQQARRAIKQHSSSNSSSVDDRVRSRAHALLQQN